MKYIYYVLKLLNSPSYVPHDTSSSGYATLSQNLMWRGCKYSHINGFGAAI